MCYNALHTHRGVCVPFKGLNRNAQFPRQIIPDYLSFEFFLLCILWSPSKIVALNVIIKYFPLSFYMQTFVLTQNNECTFHSGPCDLTLLHCLITGTYSCKQDFTSDVTDGFLLNGSLLYIIISFKGTSKGN